MTDEERSTHCELLAYLLENNAAFADSWPKLLRWLLGEYRRLKARCGESGLTEFKELELDAARWRYCERAAEPSDGNDAEPWWVLTACGPTFAEAVDAAREQVTTDWSGHQGGA